MCVAENVIEPDIIVLVVISAACQGSDVEKVKVEEKNTHERVHAVIFFRWKYTAFLWIVIPQYLHFFSFFNNHMLLKAAKIFRMKKLYLDCQINSNQCNMKKISLRSWHLYNKRCVMKTLHHALYIYFVEEPFVL